VATPLGDKIRRLRLDKQLTLEKLAEATGSAKSYIWALENRNDPPKPSAEKAQRIADALGVTVEFLINDRADADEDMAFYRQYRRMSEETKARIRTMIDRWGTESGWGNEDVPEIYSPQRWAITLTQVLNAFHGGGPNRFPVDVRTLALNYSRTRFPDDPIEHIDGAQFSDFDGGIMRMPNGRGWGIIYNEAITSPGRINFTLAHEFGHYLLHRQAFPDGIQCNSQDMVRWDSAYAKVEREANEFAAMLLMPLDDYRRQIDAKAKPDIDALARCAERYGVSLVAAVLQWLNYTERRSMLVVSRSGFILWARSSSEALRTGVFKRTANRDPEEVPPLSLAARPSVGVNGTITHPPGVWFSEACEESVVVSDRYDFVLSLLHFGPADRKGLGHDAEEDPDTVDRMRARRLPPTRS
jgi:transcriptional regulator with XRE-family HTH domain